MDMTARFGHGEGRGRGRGTWRANRRRAPGVEGLEGRQLLSTFKWENFGNDNFGTFEGASATQARQVVQAAMHAWEKTILNFNYIIHRPIRRSATSSP